MNRNHKVFPCLLCDRDTGCVNRLVCDRCRQAAVRAKARPMNQRRAARRLVSNA